MSLIFAKHSFIETIGKSYMYKEIPQVVLQSEIVKGEAGYPHKLMGFDREFEKIYIQGDVGALEKCVAVIGSRKATPYGIKIARLIGEWCSEYGLSVVSGCARGCDQASHEGALAAGGKTVAVLGCGADVIYPSNAQRLLRAIAQQGAIVSEYDWQTPPAKYRFVQRNRLIAALSELVIVVEASIPSGTFSTVNHANDLGVSVAAVPGSIFSSMSLAPNRLISDGAYCITSKKDFLTACALENIDLNEPDNILVEEQNNLLRALRAMPLTPEEVARYCKINIQEAVIRINKLEAAGKIVRHSGGKFALLDYGKVEE